MCSFWLNNKNFVLTLCHYMALHSEHYVFQMALIVLRYSCIKWPARKFLYKLISFWDLSFHHCFAPLSLKILIPIDKFWFLKRFLMIFEKNLFWFIGLLFCFSSINWNLFLNNLIQLGGFEINRMTVEQFDQSMSGTYAVVLVLLTFIGVLSGTCLKSFRAISANMLWHYFNISFIDEQLI